MSSLFWRQYSAHVETGTSFYGNLDTLGKTHMDQVFDPSRNPIHFLRYSRISMSNARAEFAKCTRRYVRNWMAFYLSCVQWVIETLTGDNDNIEWNIRETGNPIIHWWYWMKYKWLQWYMERKSINILITLNETSGKQGIQSYIADIEWNISDYNDIWKGNALILW